MNKLLIVLGSILLSSSLMAAEIDSLKLDLKRDFPDLKNEELASAEKVQKNPEQTIAMLFLKDRIYFACRSLSQKDSAWRFKDSTSRDGVGQIEFKSQNRFSIHQSEGGTSRSTTVSTWRLERDSFKVIGKEFEAFSSWNAGWVRESVNYLTGVVVASSGSEKQKKRTGSCRFDVSKFRKQQLSGMTLHGAAGPECKYAILPNR